MNFVRCGKISELFLFMYLIDFFFFKLEAQKL